MYTENVPKVLHINCHELMDTQELDPRAESIHKLNNLSEKESTEFSIMGQESDTKSRTCYSRQKLLLIPRIYIKIWNEQQ